VNILRVGGVSAKGLRGWKVFLRELEKGQGLRAKLPSPSSLASENRGGGGLAGGGLGPTAWGSGVVPGQEKKERKAGGFDSQPWPRPGRPGAAWPRGRTAASDGGHGGAVARLGVARGMDRSGRRHRGSYLGPWSGWGGGEALRSRERAVAGTRERGGGVSGGEALG